MEKLLSNVEFNKLLKEVKIEKYDYEAHLFAVVPTETPVDVALGKLKLYWKIIKPILSAIKLVTPPKADKAIDEFIVIVDHLCDGPTEEETSQLLDKFAIIWAIVRPILVVAKEFTPPKADLVIDEVVKIGDLLAKS